MKMRKKSFLLICLALLALLIGGSMLYVTHYYHADEAARQALLSDDLVSVSQTAYGWFFDGPSRESALVFYPGAKVEAQAYAPLLHELAAEGMDVCLVSMPLRFAFLDMDRAARVMEEYEYDRWYVGGHSLGGACASSFAARHGERLSGLILLGAYPTGEVDEDLAELFIYGTEDGILNREKYEQGKAFWNSKAEEWVIPGGNHAQFGSYGPQKGDGAARISPEEQIRETVCAVIAVLKESGNEDALEGPAA